MMRVTRRASLLITFSLLAATATAHADSLVVESDLLDRTDNARLIFVGNAVAWQLTWRMSADRVEVQLGEKDRFSLMTAIGNVRIATSDCWNGTAQRVEYRDQLLVLSGSVQLRRNEEAISGEDVVVRLPRVSAANCTLVVPPDTLDPRGPKGK